jgi:hypothetical protein
VVGGSNPPRDTFSVAQLAEHPAVNR